MTSFGPVTNGRRITSFFLEDVDPNELVMADAITIDRGRAGAPIAIAPGKSEGVIASMTRCDDGLMRQWGVDPVAMHKLSRQPEPVGGGAKDWFKPKDYPKVARGNFRPGRTLALLTIEADGRVAGCNIAESAGTPASTTRPARSLPSAAAIAPAWTRRANRCLRRSWSASAGCSAASRSANGCRASRLSALAIARSIPSARQETAPMKYLMMVSTLIAMLAALPAEARGGRPHGFHGHRGFGHHARLHCRTYRDELGRRQRVCA